MARSWRLRHKLVLGLALVVGSVALLLGGALFGLFSSLDAIRIVDRKVDDIEQVVQLRDHIHQIADPKGQDARDDEKTHIENKLRACRLTLEIYRRHLLADPLRSSLDPDSSDIDYYVDGLSKAFDRFHDVLDRAAAPQFNDGATRRLLDEKGVRDEYAEMNKISTGLLLHLTSNIKSAKERATANHRRSLYITGSATAIAVVLVATLLYYFRVWVFTPIKVLQAGVRRVHGGNFDSPIRLGSRDELEELADEFNAMTTRLRDIYGDLAQQVNERTRQLVRSERMVSVGFLAAGVAHEINNPLASIAFCAEALERRLQEVLTRSPAESDVIRKYLKMMQDEAQRCKQITQKLLDFSRSGGKRELTDLTALVHDVVEVAHCLPNSRGKEVIFQPESTVIAPVSVPDIKGVVLNLIVNALDSMEERGRLLVNVTANGENALLTFADTGCGMAAETLNNIFEPFFTRSRTGNGTGLGLSISHQIIDQHGGTISATSPGLGKGSTFTVRLPLRDASSGSTADRSPETPILSFPAQRTAAA